MGFRCVGLSNEQCEAVEGFIGGREYNFQVVYGGETLALFVEGGSVFLQR